MAAPAPALSKDQEAALVQSMATVDLNEIKQPQQQVNVVAALTPPVTPGTLPSMEQSISLSPTGIQQAYQQSIPPQTAQSLQLQQQALLQQMSPAGLQLLQLSPQALQIQQQPQQMVMINGQLFPASVVSPMSVQPAFYSSPTALQQQQQLSIVSTTNISLPSSKVETPVIPQQQPASTLQGGSSTAEQPSNVVEQDLPAVAENGEEEVEAETVDTAEDTKPVVQSPQASIPTTTTTTTITATTATTATTTKPAKPAQSPTNHKKAKGKRSTRFWDSSLKIWEDIKDAVTPSSKQPARNDNQNDNHTDNDHNNESLMDHVTDGISTISNLLQKDSPTSTTAQTQPQPQTQTGGNDSSNTAASPPSQGDMSGQSIMYLQPGESLSFGYPGSNIPALQPTAGYSPSSSSAAAAVQQQQQQEQEQPYLLIVSESSGPQANNNNNNNGAQEPQGNGSNYDDSHYDGNGDQPGNSTALAAAALGSQGQGQTQGPDQLTAQALDTNDPNDPYDDDDDDDYDEDGEDGIDIDGMGSGGGGGGGGGGLDWLFPYT